MDPHVMWRDPYPTFAQMRASYPLARVPLLRNSLVFTRYSDCEELLKRPEILTSHLNNDPLVELMGRNVMRKDGDQHRLERRAINASMSAKVARSVWTEKFTALTKEALDDIEPRKEADALKDIAMRIAGEALKQVTGLTQITWQEMDRVSQGMMDSLSNVTEDPVVARNGVECAAAIDGYVDEMLAKTDLETDPSMLGTQVRAGLNEEELKANVKLTIGGGQNEPRDAISGAMWALMSHPEQLALVRSGAATWDQVFDEYVRFVAPIGIITRDVARPFERHGVQFKQGEMVVFALASANRDEIQFPDPDTFDITRKNSTHIAFSVGPHFCGGAFVSRALIADVALPMIFERLQGLEFSAPTIFGGFAFRGPVEMKVRWS